MRYEKGHKDATRRRIVEVASRRFRKDGVAAVGVAGLMADAGLTHGGFYAHFGSKEDLVRDAVSDTLGSARARLERLAAGEPGGIEAIIRTYLSPLHRDQPEDGCAFAALAPELARHPAPTRSALAQRFEAYVELIARHLPSIAPAERQRRAIAIFGALMGTLQLARAVPDKRLSDEILESGIEAALMLAQHPVPRHPAS